MNTSQRHLRGSARDGARVRLHPTCRALVAALGLAAFVAPASANSDPSSSDLGEIAVGVYERIAPDVVFVDGATVWTQTDRGTLENADVVIRDRRIVKVGTDLSAPKRAFVIDGTGKHVTPGLIDCHSHTAVRGGVNEGSNNVTAEVRILDVLNPDDVNLYRQLAGGLTAAHVLHGSANSIGGQDAVIKLAWGASLEDLIVEDATPGIKFALGENPKRSRSRSTGGNRRYPATRMGVLESIRERFVAARDYERRRRDYDALTEAERARAEPPRRDLQLDAIVEILRGERGIHSHSYRQDEILGLVRLAEEFGVRIHTFQHVLEGYKVADELAAHGVGASTFSDWWAFKFEAYDAIPWNGALMHERGVNVTFNSDSSELARRMNLEAAKAVRYGGVEETDALDFVTRNAAIQLGIDHRTGSIAPGLDADFVVWSGHPLSTRSIVEQTWVSGTRQFDRAQDLASRDAIDRARERAIAAVRGDDENTGDAESESPDDGSEDDTTEASGDDDRDDAPWRTPRFPHASVRPGGEPGAVSIVNATVHTLDGPPIEGGTVSFVDGVIVEVGAGLAPLEGATVVDASARNVLPGFLDANSALGLTEIGSVPGSIDTAETGRVNPEIEAALAVHAASELLPVSRTGGVTHAIVAPTGGEISGTSALVRLDGWTREDVVRASPLALQVRWPSFRTFRSRFPGAPSRADQKKRREEALERIDRVFDDAEAYRLAKDAMAAGGPTVDVVRKLEAMLPVLDGERPVVIHASEVRQIRNALDWAERRGLAIAIAGSGDLWRVADRLAASDVPVLLTSVLALPRRADEPYDVRFTEAAKLHDAGVRFSFAGSGGGFSAANSRNLAHHAAMAVAFGLPHDAALRALSRNAAEILGLGDTLGTIAPGRSASLIVVDGDPLEITSGLDAMFIDGRAIALEDNKHERLYRKYRGRPMPGSSAAP